MSVVYQNTKNLKNSGVEWIGNIPKNWITRRGKFILRNKKEINNDMRCDNVLSLTMKGVIHRNELGEGGLLPENYSTFQIFYSSDLVFKLIDLENYKTSRVGIVSEKGIMSSAYIRIFPAEKDIYNRYFYYYYYNLYLQGIYNFIGMGVRSTMNAHDLLELQIVIPPIETQKRIAYFLDEKTEIIDQIIEKNQKHIELLKEQRTAVITKTVTKGLDPNVEMKNSGVEWIGDIPGGWEINPALVYITETKKKNIGLKEQNLLSLSYGEIITKEISSSFGLLPASFETYQIIIPGQIIFRLTDLQNDKKSLRSGLVKQTGIITSAYVAIRIKKGLIPEYLNYLFRSYDIKKVFYTLGAGVRQSSGFDELKKLPLIVPSADIQNEIVNFLDKKTGEIGKYIDKVQKRIKKLKEYRASLIYNAVTGKIKV